MKKNNESTIKKLFNHLNLYGMPFAIRYKNKSTYTSTIGIILSLISIFIFTGLIIYYFLDLITHSSFSILVCNDKSKLHSINLSNIPIMLGFLDLNFNLFLINQEIFSLSVWIKSLTIKNTKKISILKRIELELCNNSIYIKKYPEMKIYDLSKYYCIKPNQKIELKGREGDLINGYNSLNFFFGYCISDNCFNQNNSNLENELNKVLNGTYLSIIYLSDVIDHYNYKKPIYQKFRNDLYSISKSSYKIFSYYFTSLTYMNDNGIFFNNIKNFSSFIFDYLNLDFLDKNNMFNQMSFNNKNYSMVFKLSYSCSEYPITYQRIYLKIQDIVGKIGGSINFIFILFNYITKYFSRKNFVVDITDTLVCHNCINNCTKNCKKENNKISKFITNDITNIENIINSSIENHIDKINKRSLNISDIKRSNYENNSKMFIFPQKINSNNNISNFNNSKLDKYLKHNTILYHQKLKLTFFDYIIPFICLRRLKKYDLICTFNDILYSYLSLEEILPSIEKVSKLFKEKKNDKFLKIQSAYIFDYENNEIEEKKI